MLLAILLILLQTGTTYLQILLTTEFSERRQILLWLSFFASFVAKVPMVSVHIWLHEAHVEAPTAGCVILARILLKLGTYGQIDLKKIIAYSLVAHMNLVTIGMFSRAAAVRSPIFSYRHKQGKNMYLSMHQSTYSH
ncbi:hypothetical protein ZWY2020_015081 [Hordeum vulgare]|nr:hypothetical protein ZWY2020_015081 [Hordeum vulgare]